MSPNGVIEDARTFRLLPDAQRRTTLINFVKALNAPDQKLVVFDLLERRQIPRSLSSAELQILASAAGVTRGVVAEGFDELSDGTISQLVKVRPPAEGVDPVANVAAQKTREEFQQRLAAYPKPPLATRGITGTVEKVTGRLNALNLGDARRLVLSQPPVYELLFLEALDDGQIAGDDAAGIVDHIVSHVDDEALVHLLRGIVDAVLAANRIELSEDERDDLARLAVARGVNLGSGRLAPSVLELVEVRRRQGNVPRYVDHYLTLQEISAEGVDESIRQAMIEYLVGLQLNMTFAAVVNREFDEYFAVAYTEARKQRAVSDDPIDLARSGRRSLRHPTHHSPRQRAHEHGGAPAGDPGRRRAVHGLRRGRDPADVRSRGRPQPRLAARRLRRVRGRGGRSAGADGRPARRSPRRTPSAGCAIAGSSTTATPSCSRACSSTSDSTSSSTG